MEQFSKEGYKCHHGDSYGRGVFEQPHEQSGKTKQELSHRLNRARMKIYRDQNEIKGYRQELDTLQTCIWDTIEGNKIYFAGIFKLERLIEQLSSTDSKMCEHSSVEALATQTVLDQELNTPSYHIDGFSKRHVKPEVTRSKDLCKFIKRQNMLVTQKLLKFETTVTEESMRIREENNRHVKQTLKLKEDVDRLEKELEDTKNRLSKLMGQKLTDNNPNIADLNDQNRPTKLAERYTQLYDNQWSDAFEEITDGNDAQTVDSLLNILKRVMTECQHNAAMQTDMLEEKLTLDKQAVSDIPDFVRKQIKDCRKTTADISSKKMFKLFIDSLESSDPTLYTIAAKIPDYVQESCELCWLMCLQDPPVVLGSIPRYGEAFNTSMYKAYTKCGPRVQYVVWPPLCLYEDGPLLCKGIAQGFE